MQLILTIFFAIGKQLAKIQSIPDTGSFTWCSQDMYLGHCLSHFIVSTFKFLLHMYIS